MKRPGNPITISVFALLFTVACGGRPAAVTPRTPDSPLDREPVCKGTKVRSDPFVVEWPSASRARLESLARSGPIFVRIDGCSIEPISGCSAAGSYRYSPITTKHENVAIRNADELHGSVPLGAASLEGKLASAGQLTVSMTIVGRLEADRTVYPQSELRGPCEQATHVVSALTIGAFRFFAGVDSGASGNASAFGATAGGSTSSSSELLAEDGQLAACDAATVNDSRPPAQCGAVMRIEVVPVGAGAAPAKPATHECAESDVDDCRTQCDLGNGPSCVHLGQWQYATDMSSPASHTKAIPYYRRACDLGDQTGCALLGLRTINGDGITYDPVAGLKLLKSACAALNATGCHNLNSIYFSDKKVKPDDEGIELLKKYCDTGVSEFVCSSLRAAGHLP